VPSLVAVTCLSLLLWH